MASIFNPKALCGKTAFVTGGGSGICKGIAEAYMRHGADVVIFGRSKERLEKASAELEANTGRKCLPVSGDVRSFIDLEKAFSIAKDQFGKIDLVVCGAAGNFLASSEKLSSNGFKTVLDIDTVGTFNTC